jgi:uncharacterized protein YceH (UPF0502 family)
MWPFEDIGEVEVELEHLSRLPEPIVARLARRPGQKEERWVQLLTDSSTATAGQAAEDVPGGGATSALAPDLEELRAEVAELRDQVARLGEDVEALRRAFGPPPALAGM